MQSNRDLHRFLVNGVPVSFKQGDQEVFETAFLLDFAEPANNAFRAVNQFEVRGTRLRRPDIVCFINGLPLTLIELKNPADEKTGIWEAFNQCEGVVSIRLRQTSTGCAQKRHVYRFYRHAD